MVAKSDESRPTYFFDNFILGQPIGIKPSMDILQTNEQLLRPKNFDETTYIIVDGQPKKALKSKFEKNEFCNHCMTYEKNCLTTKTWVLVMKRNISNQHKYK